MAIDTRDHYIERLRKRTSYVERSTFRMSEMDKTRARRRRALRRVALLLVLLAAALLVRRYLVR